MMHIQRRVASTLNGFVTVAYEEWLKGVGTFNMKSGKLWGSKYVHTMNLRGPKYLMEPSTLIYHNSKYISSEIWKVWIEV